MARAIRIKVLQVKVTGEFSKFKKSDTNLDNATKYLNAGASHVIVTSFVFRDGDIDFNRLRKLRELVGKERLVVDLSCRRRPNEEGEGNDGMFYVVTNKWTKFTKFSVT